MYSWDTNKESETRLSLFPCIVLTAYVIWQDLGMFYSAFTVNQPSQQWEATLFRYQFL